MTTDIINSFMNDSTQKNSIENLKINKNLISGSWKFLSVNKTKYKILNNQISEYNYGKTKVNPKKLTAPPNLLSPKMKNIQFQNELIQKTFNNSLEKKQKDNIDYSDVINLIEGNYLNNKINSEIGNKINPKYFHDKKILDLINNLLNKKSNNNHINISYSKMDNKKLFLKNKYPEEKSIDPLNYINYNILSDLSGEAFIKKSIALKKINSIKNKYLKSIIIKGIELSNDQFPCKHTKIPSENNENINKLKNFNIIENVDYLPSVQFSLKNKKRNKLIINYEGLFKNYVRDNKNREKKSKDHYLSFDEKINNTFATSKKFMKNINNRCEQHGVLLKKITDIYDKTSFI